MTVLDRKTGTDMSAAPAECTAFDEAVVFLGHFKDPQHPRPQGTASYAPEEILLLSPLAAPADVLTMTEIAQFGCNKLAPPHRFRPVAVGTMSPISAEHRAPPPAICKPEGEEPSVPAARDAHDTRT